MIPYHGVNSTMVGGWKKEDFIGGGGTLAGRRLPASYRLFARLPKLYDDDVDTTIPYHTITRLVWAIDFGAPCRILCYKLLFMGRDWARRLCILICFFANAKSIQTHVQRACLFRRELISSSTSFSSLLFSSDTIVLVTTTTQLYRRRRQQMQRTNKNKEYIGGPACCTQRSFYGLFLLCANGARANQPHRCACLPTRALIMCPT